MKEYSGFVRKLLWVIYALSVMVNGFSLYAVCVQSPSFNVAWFIAGFLLLTVGLVLFTVPKSRPWIGLLVTLAAAVCLAVNTVKLGEAFPVGQEGYGMTAWKLIWRHWSVQLIPLLMLADTVRVLVLARIKQGNHLPMAELIRAEDVADGALFAGTAVAEDQLRCPLCRATFGNAVHEQVFKCPYCHGRLRRPGIPANSKKEKRRAAARERREKEST